MFKNQMTFSDDSNYTSFFVFTILETRMFIFHSFPFYFFFQYCNGGDLADYLNGK